ncbi:MAG TPA: conjugative transposon protein TraM, partial [Bacteroidia bacterium]|nr:conjugative transposon protein TraM [Bacteroidia bacterium]
TAEKQSDTFINANANASDEVTDNSVLDFYTVDQITVGNVLIPMHTRFSTTVRLFDGRAYLKARSIKIGDDIYEIDWSAVGPDFKEGIPYEVEKQSFEVYSDQKVTFKAFVK